MSFPELTREQMMERCDLAGVARVVAVGRASSDAPTLAKLVFLKFFLRHGTDPARQYSRMNRSLSTPVPTQRASLVWLQSTFMTLSRQ